MAITEGKQSETRWLVKRTTKANEGKKERKRYKENKRKKWKEKMETSVQNDRLLPAVELLVLAESFE